MPEINTWETTTVAASILLHQRIVCKLQFQLLRIVQSTTRFFSETEACQNLRVIDARRRRLEELGIGLGLGQGAYSLTECTLYKIGVAEIGERL